MRSKRLALTAAAVAVTAALATVGHAAFVVPYDLDVEQIAVDVPALPREWRGQELAVLSDLQVGMWAANLGAAEEAVDMIVEREPAAVLLAGDLLYSDDPPALEQTALVSELLQPLLTSGIPVVAVLGNHDHESGYAAELSARLESIGVDVLRNEIADLRPPGGGPPLAVVGIGSRRAGLDRPAVAFAALPDDAPRVVLMHNPASFPALPAGTAPIAFAGHTHCGQIVLPLGDGWSRLELRVDERYVVRGFASPEYGAPGNDLYVTCGIGMSRLPLRLGAHPQVVFATLRDTASGP